MDHPLNPEGDPSKAAVLEVWKALETAGYQRPPAWQGKRAAENVAKGLDVWVALTSDVEPRRLLAAGLLWLRQDRRGFWPVPGQVLQALADTVKAQDMSGDEGWGLASRLMGRFGRSRVPCETQAELDGLRSDREGFLLHEDPETARALQAGIDAIGSWRKFGILEENDPAARASFRSAFERSFARTRNQRAFRGLATAIGASKLPALLPAPVPDFTGDAANPDLELVRNLTDELERSDP